MKNSLLSLGCLLCLFTAVYSAEHAILEIVNSILISL